MTTFNQRSFENVTIREVDHLENTMDNLIPQYLTEAHDTHRSRSPPQRHRRGINNISQIYKKYLPIDRRCIVHRKPLEKEPWISHDNLIKYKTTASVSEKPTKVFLNLLYSDESYKKWLNKTKRGNKAVNWRESDGTYLCPSLHLADNIYCAFGKKNWRMNGNHGQQIKKDDNFRCQKILKGGKRCSRKECDIGTHYCTLHHKKFMLDR